jgi:signal transduction histidine kinase/CheY-like chemotaxis protein
MGLKFKTSATITLIFLALVAIMHAVLVREIAPTLSSAEMYIAENNLSKLVSDTQDLARDLQRRAEEWSHTSNLVDPTTNTVNPMVRSHLERQPFEFDDLLILDPGGRVVFTGHLDGSAPSFSPIALERESAILSIPALQSAQTSPLRGANSGFARIAGAPAIIAFSPILDPSSKSENLGTLILVRGVSPEIQADLLKNLPPSSYQSHGRPILEYIPHGMARDSQYRFEPIAFESSESDLLTSSAVITDLEGSPLIRLSLTSPRDIITNGTRVTQNTLMVVAGSLLLSNLLILAFINRALLYPIRRLSNLLSTISRTHDLSVRAPLGGSDEIGALTNAVNRLLEGTQRSYQDMLTARDEAERANGGKSLFIAKVSHELRTPIHAITGMLRILMKQEPNSGRRTYIQMAQDAAKGLLETINEILDFSKMETGSLSLERVEFSLHETIRTMVAHLIPRFEEKPNVELCWDISPQVPDRLIGDPLRLKNVLTNLVGNAFKFTSQGHVSLLVSTFPAKDRDRIGIRFQVKDSGIGIPADRLADIFNPFTQADESTARLYAGTGLGLAIVKQVVEQMGGSVAARSILGQGSTFTVEAPFESPSIKRKERPNALTSGSTVAVLSERTTACELLSEGLDRYGWTVRNFYWDHAQAIQLIMESIESFDLIHISTTSDLLADEIAPLLKLSAHHNIPVVMAARPSEMAGTERFGRYDTFFVTHKPMSALDLLMIAAGKLSPSIPLSVDDDEQEKSDHQLRILIADDAATNRIILKTLLEEAGHSVEVVENGQQMLDRIIQSAQDAEHGRRSLDVVMTDIQMPVMDGLTAAQHVRDLEKEHSRIKKLPIIAVTAYAFPEECTRMRASGIDHIITKPISPRRLSRLLSQITCEVVTERDEPQNATDLEVIKELCRITDDFSKQMHDITANLSPESSAVPRQQIDISGVFERSGSSLRRTGLIFSGFLTSFQEPLEVIRGARLPVQDPVAYRRAAHSLKGLLLDVGAGEVAELASALERQAAQEPAAITHEMAERLVVEVIAISSLLKDLVQALPSLEVFAALPALDEGAALH